MATAGALMDLRISLRTPPGVAPTAPGHPACAAATAAGAAGAAAGRRLASSRRPAVHCAAAGTQQGRGRRTEPGQGSSWRDDDAGSSTLLRRIADCAHPRDLHLLLARHSRELGGREVAAALDAAAKRRLLQPGGGGSGASDAGSDAAAGSRRADAAALAALLPRLASEHAPSMDPASLSGAAWALAALQLAAGRAAMRRMHALAERRLTRFSPSELCALLWAGGSLDPGHHSPLFPALAGLVRDGMSLTLFAPRDLAALAWICGREGGGSARSITTAVVAECRQRLQAHAPAANQRAGSAPRGQRSRQPSAAPEERQTPKQKQQQSQQQQQQQLPLAAAPPPPFGPAEAAMLLTGLAAQQLRVEGLVEPMLRQCGAQLAAAQPNDAARILIALADLLMPVDSELLGVLVGRLAEVAPQLSAQQVVAALWAALRLDHATPRLATLGVQHYQAHAADYKPVDLVGMLWAVAQHRARSLPDAALCSVLAALQPEVGQLSDGGLCNLLWALARISEDRDGSSAGSWLAGCAGAAAVAAAEAALGELARRGSGAALKPADLVAAANAVAAHPPLAAALPAADMAALRDACAAAAGADAFTPSGVAQVAAAAARLRWADRAFVDALAGAVQLRINLSVTTSNVFAQAVSALAALAPGRYGRLFDSLAVAYATKLSQSAQMSTVFYGFSHEERGAVLGAFAAVTQAQRLPASTLQLLVRPNENRKFGLHEVPPLLVLAAEAGQPADAPAVAAALRDLDKAPGVRLRSLGHEPLLQMRAALARLQCDTRARLAAIDAALEALGRA